MSGHPARGAPGPAPAFDLTEQLERVVAALDRGDLTAGPIARAHLAGALAAFEARTLSPRQ